VNGSKLNRVNDCLIDVRYSSRAVFQRVTTINPFTCPIAVLASSDFCIRDNTTSVATKGKYDQLDGTHILDSSFGEVQSNSVGQ
jgi:hypothetical protein